MSRPAALLRLILALLLGAALTMAAPLRHRLIPVIRLPWVVVTACAHVLIELPRLPFLLRENYELRARLLEQQRQIAQLQESVRAAEQAGQLLARAPMPQSVVASILSYSPIPTQHTLLVNRGQRQGIVLDSVVLDMGGIVGRVIERSAETSLVMLLTDAESRVAAMVERSRETGVLIGRLQGACEVIYLDAGADLQPGDRIVTAGLEGPFPKGFSLGVVTRVMRDPERGSARAWVSPSAHLGQLEEVLVIPPASRASEPSRP